MIHHLMFIKLICKDTALITIIIINGNKILSFHSFLTHPVLFLPLKKVIFHLIYIYTDTKIPNISKKHREIFGDFRKKQ